MQEHGAKVSLNNPGGEAVLAKAGGTDSGLPFFAFLTEDGALIVNSLRPAAAKSGGSNIGYPAKPEEVDWFLVMVRKAAPGMSQDEAGVLERYLRGRK